MQNFRKFPLENRTFGFKNNNIFVAQTGFESMWVPASITFFYSEKSQEQQKIL